MIAFATLFLGLVLGVQPVEVMVAPSVARVDVLLDGSLACRMEAAPWRVPCDLGGELAPARLEAVAFDTDGGEIGRTVQWLNLPRPPAETRVLVEGGEGGRGVTARLSWDAVADREPSEVRVTFDGRPLTPQDPRRISLPAHDPEQLHFLRAELTFPGGASSVLEATFGGVYADRLERDLTGVPVQLEGDGDLPEASELAGWLAGQQEALEVVAVETGPADVLVVRDLGAQEDLNRLALPGSGVRRTGPGLTGPGMAVVGPTSPRYVARLGRDHRLRLISTFENTLQRPDYSLQLFTSTEPFTAADGGLLWLLQGVRATPPADAPQRLADAVAAAGVEAAAGARRRAVVLVLGPNPEDSSQFDAATVRGYLRALHVPLVVWRTRQVTAATAAWGEATEISTATRLETAAKQLRRGLDRQRIVWVGGTHLPQEIALTDRARGLRLAGG